MSTVVTSKAGSAAAAADSNSPFGVIGAGPAALVSSILNEVMSLYLKLMDQYRQNTVDQISMEQKAAAGGANATYNSTIADSNNLFLQAGTSAFSALASVGQSVGSHFATGDLSKELGTHEGTLKGLQEFEQPLRDRFISGKSDVALTSEGGVPGNAAVEERMSGLETGDFIRGKSPHDANAIEHLDDAQHATAQRRLEAQVEESTKNVNTKATQIQTKQQLISTIGQAVTSLGTGGSQFGQGMVTKEKATQDKNKTLETTTAQMAQSGVGTTSQKQGSSYDQALAEVQMLKQIADSNQTRG